MICFENICILDSYQKQIYIRVEIILIKKNLLGHVIWEDTVLIAIPQKLKTHIMD